MDEHFTHYGGRQLMARGCILLAVSAAGGGLARAGGFDAAHQPLAVSIFVLIISATLLFWHFRLAVAFIGIAILLGAKVMSLEQMVASAELEIILFLVGMMTLVGVLKDLGLFSWIIQFVIKARKLDGPRFTAAIVFMSALMACVVDEITSIIFMMALVFQVCDTLKIRPIPFVLIAVFATNIGSSGTMLGNPVGILIGTKAGFTFQDFLVWAFPVMIVSLVVGLGILLAWYRKEIHELTECLEARRNMQLGLGPLVKIPYRTSLVILVSAITIIGLHSQIETWLGVDKNTILIVAPLAIAGVLMIWRNQRARHYVESEVEWWTLLFFMMLFSVAGSLEYAGVTEQMAERVESSFGGASPALIPVVMASSAAGSAFVDNIVFVAAVIPVIRELDWTPLWWALLFGACFGGNMTLIGSTANIVAIGMLEKRYRTHIYFMEWFKVGLVVSVMTCLVAWAALAVMAPHMPGR